MDQRERQPVIGPQGYEAPQLPTELPNEPYYQPQRHGSRRIIGLVLLIIGGLWLVSLGINGIRLPFGGADGRGAIPGGSYTVSALNIDVPEGDVEVRAWDQATTKVDVQYRGGSPDDYAIQIVPDGPTLRITGGPKPCFLFCGQRDVTYRITTPATSAAQIKTTNGTIDVSDLSSAVVLESTNSAINATNLANGLTVTAINGAVDLENVAGALQAKTTNGSITLDNGKLTSANVQAVNGAINLNGVSGNIAVESVNGSITIEDASNGILALANTNGNISYQGSLAGTATSTLNTVSGDVTLELPAASAFTLSADTSSGTITTDFDLQNRKEDRRGLGGSANGGGATLKIGTTNGDIAVNRQ